MKKLMVTVLALGLLIGAGSCRSAGHDDDDRLTVGIVQKEIRVGMSGAEVGAVLGSPNIVTTDEERREVWIYDKISTTSVRNETHGSVAALIFGGSGGGILGIGGESEAKSTTQRTITVIIYFDDGGTVRDFAYHTSRF